MTPREQAIRQRLQDVKDKTPEAALWVWEKEIEYLLALLDQLRAEGQPPDDKRERTLELLIMEFVKLFPMRHEQDSVLQHARDVAADVATLRQQLDGIVTQVQRALATTKCEGIADMTEELLRLRALLDQLRAEGPPQADGGWDEETVKRQVADFNELCEAARRYRERAEAAEGTVASLRDQVAHLRQELDQRGRQKMAVVKDWVQAAADEINALGSSDDLDKWAPEIIRKHCPFKPNTAYEEVTPLPDAPEHFLILEFRRRLTQDEWRAAIEAAHHVPHVQGLRAEWREPPLLQCIDCKNTESCAGAMARHFNHGRCMHCGGYFKVVRA